MGKVKKEATDKIPKYQSKEWETDHRNYIMSKCDLTDKLYDEFWVLMDYGELWWELKCSRIGCLNCKEKICIYAKIDADMRKIGVSEELQKEIIKASNEYMSQHLDQLVKVAIKKWTE